MVLKNISFNMETDMKRLIIAALMTLSMAHANAQQLSPAVAELVAKRTEVNEAHNKVLIETTSQLAAIIIAQNTLSATVEMFISKYEEDILELKNKNVLIDEELKTIRQLIAEIQKANTQLTEAQLRAMLVAIIQ